VTFPACLTADGYSVLRHTCVEPYSRFWTGSDEPSASLTHLIYHAMIWEGDQSTAAGAVRFDKIARFETGKWHPFCSCSMRLSRARYPATCPRLLWSRRCENAPEEQSFGVAPRMERRHVLPNEHELITLHVHANLGMPKRDRRGIGPSRAFTATAPSHARLP
jgi:hypothetical protein